MIEIANFRTKNMCMPYDVRVDRCSVLGNPFHMYHESQRSIVCSKYKFWFRARSTSVDRELDRLKRTYEHYGKLRLFCWCAPQQCHAETIKKWIEGELDV